MRHEDKREPTEKLAHSAKFSMSKKALEKAQNLAQVLFDEEWRKECFDRVEKKFPAIVTYLTQLLAHDVTHSAGANTRFELVSGRFDKGANNLRTSDLLLHTIYGEGLQLDDQLYKKKKKNGELDPCFDLMNVNIGGVDFVLPGFWHLTNGDTPSRSLRPLLGDTRNADTPMLLWITVEFMKFHNKLVVQHTARNKKRRKKEKRTQQQIFKDARIDAVLTWHNIIENDVLTNVTGCSDPRNDLPHVNLWNEQDLFHGLMRAFHALPLNRYFQFIERPDPMSLHDLLNVKAANPEISGNDTGTMASFNAIKRWNTKWRMDLNEFAGNAPRNLTCFTPSFAAKFGVSSEKNSFEASILVRDIESALRLGVSPVKEYPDLLKPTRKLLKQIAESNQDTQLPNISEVPLSFGFLAEAYYTDKKSGALGPFGAAAFNSAVTARIDQIQTEISANVGAANLKKKKAVLPQNFMDMTTY